MRDQIIHTQYFFSALTLGSDSLLYSTVVDKVRTS